MFQSLDARFGDGDPDRFPRPEVDDGWGSPDRSTKVGSARVVPTTLGKSPCGCGTMGGERRRPAMSTSGLDSSAAGRRALRRSTLVRHHADLGSVDGFERLGGDPDGGGAGWIGLSKPWESAHAPGLLDSAFRELDDDELAALWPSAAFDPQDPLNDEDGLLDECDCESPEGSDPPVGARDPVLARRQRLLVEAEAGHAEVIRDGRWERAVGLWSLLDALAVDVGTGVAAQSWLPDSVTKTLAEIGLPQASIPPCPTGSCSGGRR